MANTAPPTVFDGFNAPNPSAPQVTNAANELTALLKGEGWTIGDTTAVLTLAATADIEYLRNIPTHITIGQDDIKALARKLLQDGVDGPGEAITRLIREVAYHVTVSEADKLYAKSNPRWFSDTGKWTPGTLDTSSRGLAEAVKEAKSKLGRV